MPFPKKASPPGQDHQNSLAQAAALQRIAGKAARIGGWTIELPRRKLTWSDEIRAIHEVPDGFTPTLEDAIEFYPPEYRAEVTRKVEACIHEGRPFDFELEIITSKKRRLWIRAVGEPVRDEAGTITSIQGAFQDITPGKLAEQSAAEIEARFRRLSESLPFIVWTATTEGRVDYANHHFYKYAGLPEEADPAASWPAMVHPQDLQPSIDAWTHSLEQESIYTTDLRLLRHADQAWRWHRIHAAPIRDAKGAIALWCGTALDIHETHRLQAESNRLATRLTTTLESITDAVFTLDPEWRFTYLNAEAERLLRRDRASLLGRCVWDEFPEAVGSTFDKQYRLARAQNRTVNFEEFFPPLDSWFDVRAFPSNEGLTVYFRDITEHRRLQHQFLRTQRMESLGTLAGGIAHDLNNLLSPILMGTSLLRNWQSTEDGRKLVDQIERSARRGADLVKQVLTFARGTTGNRGPVDAGELLRELASIVTTTFPK
ncbi:MAG: PAS domain S-box protein, partial [Puniceicoccaceae bacterium]